MKAIGFILHRNMLDVVKSVEKTLHCVFYILIFLKKEQPNKTQVLSSDPRSVAFPTAMVHIFVFLGEGAMALIFTPKSLKISPAPKRSINQISSMCMHHEEDGYNANSGFHSLTVLKRN